MAEPLPAQQDATQAPNGEGEYHEQGGELCGWVMARVVPWRDARDAEYRAKWDEYFRIWRGEWAPEDKNKKSERSKIVCPASMQAVDSTCSEIDEALFRREAWFDVDEDFDEAKDPKERQPMLQARDRLLELMEEEKVPAAISRCVLIGAISGTLLGKIDVYVKDLANLQMNEDGTRAVIHREEMRGRLCSMTPYEFVPDPTVEDPNDGLGWAHETILPRHEVKMGMKKGQYRECPLGTWAPTASDPVIMNAQLTQVMSTMTEGVKITEWHGFVPSAFLAKWLYPEDVATAALTEDSDEDDLVEAIVTIANEAKVIAAKPTPFIMKDRSLVWAQFDTVPGTPWGRGVIEKAYNAQKALDANVRARIDSLALVANPMVAGDVTRLPRGMNLAVWPGKFWPTTGSPNDVLQPFQFGQVNPELFSSAADMERMVQTATGAMDPGMGYSQATGAQDRAMMGSAFIKRARRTMQNIEWHFMRPLVQKMMWRYVQFHPEFPQDFKFTVRGTLGVMAREVEAQQQIQMLSLVPNESRPFMALLKSVFDNSASPHKNEVIAAIDSMLNPSEEEKQQQQMMQQLQMAQVKADADKKSAEAEEAQGKAREAIAKAKLAEAQAQMAPLEVAAQFQKNETDQREVAAFEQQNAISDKGMQLKTVDLALRAAKLPVEISEIEANAAKLRADANRPKKQ